MYARVVAHKTALEAFIDKRYSSADRSSADDEDAMEVDLFEGAEPPRATLRPTSATSAAAVGEHECIAALQNAMIDLLDEEDLALQQETEGEEDEDAAFIPAEPAAPAAAAAPATTIAAAAPAAAIAAAETSAETAAAETAAAVTTAEPADAGLPPPHAPPAAKRQRVLAAASARVRAGQELRELLTQVKLLERGGSSSQAAEIVDEQLSRPEPSDHLARKRADELQRNLFSIGDWKLTAAALEKFLAFPAVARLRRRDAPAPKRTDEVDADTATELLAAAKAFFTEIMRSSGRRTAEDMNAFWAGAAALLPPDLLQNRHGRAAMRILGVVSRLKRAQRARGARRARTARARFSHTPLVRHALLALHAAQHYRVIQRSTIVRAALEDRAKGWIRLSYRGHKDRVDLRALTEWWHIEASTEDNANKQAYRIYHSEGDNQSILAYDVHWRRAALSTDKELHRLFLQWETCRTHFNGKISRKLFVRWALRPGAAPWHAARGVRDLTRTALPSLLASRVQRQVQVHPPAQAVRVRLQDLLRRARQPPYLESRSRKLAGAPRAGQGGVHVLHLRRPAAERALAPHVEVDERPRDRPPAVRQGVLPALHRARLHPLTTCRAANHHRRRHDRRPRRHRHRRHRRHSPLRHHHRRHRLLRRRHHRRRAIAAAAVGHTASAAGAGDHPRADRHAARVQAVRDVPPALLHRQVRLQVVRQRRIEPTLPKPISARAALLRLGQHVPDAVPDRRGQDRDDHVPRLAGDAPQAWRGRRPRPLRGGARADSGHARAVHDGLPGLCDHLPRARVGVPRDAAGPQDVRGQQGQRHRHKADRLRGAGTSARCAARAARPRLCCNPTTHMRALRLLPPLSRGWRSALCSACTLPPARPR